MIRLSYYLPRLILDSLHTLQTDLLVGSLIGPPADLPPVLGVSLWESRLQGCAEPPSRSDVLL